MIIVKAPKVYKEMQLAATGTATDPVEMPLNPKNAAHKLILEAVTERVFFNFSDSTAAGGKADKTVDGTTKQVAKGFSVAAGMAIEVNIAPGESERFVSVQATSSATGIIKLCEPES